MPRDSKTRKKTIAIIRQEITLEEVKGTDSIVIQEVEF